MQFPRYGFMGTIICSIAMMTASIGAAPSIGQFQVFGFRSGDYRVTPEAPNGSQPFVEITAAKPRTDEFAAVWWPFDPAPWRGKRIRISAQLRTTAEVHNATLIARIDSPTIMSFDGPTEAVTDSDAPWRRLGGEHDWTSTHVVLDVPLDATTIFAGALLQGTQGAVYASLPQITVVGDDVATTGSQLPTTAAPVSSIPPIDPSRRVAVVNDLRKVLVPITTTDPDALNEDTKPILQAIGAARIIGLGEATHGTAEFFNLKDRLFRDLVRQRGATVFAIEAPQPEVREMDRYVVTGAGDPRHALRSMLFWDWNTEEVLALANWMRHYNALRGKRPALHFAGFDMQSAAVAARSLVSDIAKANSGAGKRAAGGIACIQRPYVALKSMDDNAWHSCRSSIDAIGPLVTRYVSDVDVRHDFAILKQYAESGRHLFDTSSESNAIRDNDMADNVSWLANVRYPGQKIVLWAHSGHIADRVTPFVSMGSVLEQRLGGEYYRLGFAFNGGSIRAYVDGTDVPVSLASASPDSFDGVLHSASAGTVFLNLARLPTSTLVKWLDAPTWHREIGGTYNPEWATAYFTEFTLRDDFDGLIFVDQSHASKSLTSSNVQPKDLASPARSQ